MGLTAHPFGLSSFGVPVIPGMSGVMAFRKVYFVDGTKGSDGNNGLSVDQAYATVQKALNMVKDQDTILVLGTPGASYDEALAIGQMQSTADMVAGQGRACNLIGVSAGMMTYGQPEFYNVSGSTASLRVRSPGWRISGIRFLGDSGSPVMLALEYDQAAATSDTDWSPGTTVDNCRFLGVVGNCIGIDFQGAPYNCRIVDNIFELFPTAAKPAIGCSVSGTAQAYRTIVANNRFIDNVQSINMNPRGFNSSHIYGNIFDSGHSNTVTQYLNNGGGSNCAVVGNYFPGDYSNTGGYKAGTSDNWAGNFADDTSEAEVGDNAITTAVPAA